MSTQPCGEGRRGDAALQGVSPQYNMSKITAASWGGRGGDKDNTELGMDSHCQNNRCQVHIQATAQAQVFGACMLGVLSFLWPEPLQHTAHVFALEV